LTLFLANLVIESPGGFRTDSPMNRDEPIITASIGVAVYPNDGLDKESLISAAHIILL
jgi:GGDEF domain-containing protein